MVGDDPTRPAVPRTARPRPAAVEAASGIWSIPIRLPGSLGFSNVYAIRTGDGVVLVDAGYHGAARYETLLEGLAAAGAGVEDVVGIVITHAHNDHFGLVEPVRDASGCWVGVTGHEFPFGRDRWSAGAVYGDHAVLDWCGRWGVSEAELAAMRAAMVIFSSGPELVPDVAYGAGDRVDLGRRQLEVLHTPGHTVGHISLVDRDARLMLVGDTVFRDLCPNVSLGPGSGLDPLADHQRSLEKLLAYPGYEALPGHGEPCDPAVRAAENLAHHERQLRAVHRLVEGGASTVAEVARAMMPVPFAVDGGLGMFAALGEAHAYLAGLVRLGIVEELGGTPLRWAPI
jgi:glyoxylase-like metal-dependent hydrolase (beta-lactamase superfamily II)